ncbi:hypothetical protein CU669_18240 [Paramagnetospirillum kuznetsovii]|uniref:Uncharacterized protein n=2 Tax=Paramagnetospirillum kuznetsovii TaxID=2053833 RepID=A0A364NTT1_9PROT|nr:hypothetical protein CU669_18240 [Paramagnetospirillum kuznetsovii]
MSTATSAITSLELGLAVTANLMAQGTTANANINYTRSALGKVDARERIPLVVGFAGSKIPEGNQVPLPQFGWVFGPHVALDPASQKLTLVQGVRDHTLTAEISVPGWWPYINLDVESAWIANWNEGESAKSALDGEENLTAKRSIVKHLSPNRADFDGLSEALARATFGGSLANTRIIDTSPNTVTVCGSETTILIYGSSIWRGSQVYLNGIKATQIDVLPDMAGLAATFDSSKLPKAMTDAELVVWTRDGPARALRNIVSPKNCNGTAEPNPNLPGNMSSSVTHYLVNTGGMLTVKTGSPLKDYASLSLQVRPTTPRGGVPATWISGTGAVSASNDGLTYAQKITLDPEDINLKGKSAPLLEARLVVTRHPGGDPEYKPISAQIVYYGSEPQAAVSTDGPMTKLDQPITVSLPQKAKLAFPGFSPGKSKIKATINSDFPLKVAQNYDAESNQLSLVLLLAPKTGGKTEADLRSAARTITLEWADKGTPPFQPTTVSLPAAAK